MTNLTLPSRAVVRFYNKRGTAEQWIKEGKQALKMTRLSCHRFLRSNEARFPDVDRLLEDADRVARRHMLGAVWNLRVGGGRVSPSLGMLARGIRTEPRLLGDPATYGVLGAIFLGPAVGERARSRLYGRRNGGGGIRARR